MNEAGWGLLEVATVAAVLYVLGRAVFMAYWKRPER